MLKSNLKPIRSLAPTMTADDTGVAMAIKCFGPVASYPDPQVVYDTSAHTLTFYKNYNSGTNSVTETDMLQVGGTAGVIALTGADRTFADVAAMIGSSPNWGAILICALPTDLIYKTSGTLDACVAIAAGTTNATACQSEDGLQLKFDTSVDVGQGFHYDLCLGPEALDSTFATFMGRRSRPDNWDDANRDIADFTDPTSGTLTGKTTHSCALTRGYVTTITSQATYSTGTSAVTVYSASQTAVKTLLTYASGATTVALPKDLTPLQEVMSDLGERLVVRLKNSAAPSAASLTALGGFGVQDSI